jgi:plasmid stability protein
MAQMILNMDDALKERVRSAAQTAGISMTQWCLTVITDALEPVEVPETSLADAYAYAQTMGDRDPAELADDMPAGAKQCKTCGEWFVPSHHFVVECDACKAKSKGTCLICRSETSKSNRFCGNCWGGKNNAKWLFIQFVYHGHLSYGQEGSKTLSDVRKQFAEWVNGPEQLNLATDASANKLSNTEVRDILKDRAGITNI